VRPGAVRVGEEHPVEAAPRMQMAPRRFVWWVGHGLGWRSTLAAMRAAVIGHAAFTFAMCGLMLTVQLVLYPQFRSVDPAAFSSYAADHAVRIGVPLALLAPAEMVFAAWLFLSPVEGIGRPAAFISGLLLAIIWISTAIYFGPFHGRFQSQPYDLAEIERLISMNWIRTVLWCARGGCAGWFLWKVIGSSTAATP